MKPHAFRFDARGKPILRATQTYQRKPKRKFPKCGGTPADVKAYVTAFCEKNYLKQ